MISPIYTHNPKQFLTSLRGRDGDDPFSTLVKGLRSKAYVRVQRVLVDAFTQPMEMPPDARSMH